MQITPNSDTPPVSSEPSTEANPLPEGQDQVVIVLDFRREDPENGDGSSTPDLAFLLAGHDPEKLQAFSFLLDNLAEVLGFDPSLSQFGLVKVVDFEADGGTLSLDEFRSIVQGLAPTTTEVLTEQPIEQVENDAPTPGDLEDVPHDLAPEVTIDELVDDGAIAPPNNEDAPVGDSVASEPGPVDPPVEG